MTTIVLLWEREANTWHLTVLMAYCTFHSNIFCTWFLWNGYEKHDAFILTVLVLLALFITLDHEIFFFFCVRRGNRSCVYLSLVCGLQILSVTNNTECVKLLEEIKCAHCSPHAQNLFHSPEKGETSERELTLPYLCKDYCKEFYYTCRGHIPGKAYNKIRN